MNPIDIYKKLPKKNCGKCPAGTCMAFAVQVLRRLMKSSECTELDEQGRKEIETMLSSPGDWKERRLQELFQEIFNSPSLHKVERSEIAEGIGATFEDNGLKIRYMGKDVVITPSEFREELTAEDMLLILMYIKHAGSKPLTCKWVSFRDLKDGLIRSESFHEACEQTLARMYGRDPQRFIAKITGLGGKETKGFPAKHSIVISPLPKTPFLLLLQPGDEEFDPDCRILFDSTITDYIDVEALLYLGIALVRAIGS